MWFSNHLLICYLNCLKEGRYLTINKLQINSWLAFSFLLAVQIFSFTDIWSSIIGGGVWGRLNQAPLASAGDHSQGFLWRPWIWFGRSNHGWLHVKCLPEPFYYLSSPLFSSESYKLCGNNSHRSEFHMMQILIICSI